MDDMVRFRSGESPGALNATVGIFSTWAIVLVRFGRRLRMMISKLIGQWTTCPQAKRAAAPHEDGLQSP
jgi:hypothetical protein